MAVLCTEMRACGWPRNRAENRGRVTMYRRSSRSFSRKVLGIRNSQRMVARAESNCRSKPRSLVTSLEKPTPSAIGKRSGSLVLIESSFPSSWTQLELEQYWSACFWDSPEACTGTLRSGRDSASFEPATSHLWADASVAKQPLDDEWRAFRKAARSTPRSKKPLRS